MKKPDRNPDISLVVPAWDEAAYLPRLLDSVDGARARYPGGADAIEVIVADNDSTDETSEVARARGCRVARVAKRSIAAARNGGAAVARGTFVCFTDADCMIHPETFNYIQAMMRRRGFIGGATGVVMERWSAGVAATWGVVMLPLWSFGLDGGVYFCRRSDFERVGGFDETVRAGEDVRFIRAMKRLGRGRRPQQRFATRFTARMLGLCPPIAVASCRKLDERGDWCMLALTLRGLFWMLFSRRRLDDIIHQHWYER